MKKTFLVSSIALFLLVYTHTFAQGGGAIYYLFRLSNSGDVEKLKEVKKIGKLQKFKKGNFGVVIIPFLFSDQAVEISARIKMELDVELYRISNGKNCVQFASGWNFTKEKKNELLTKYNVDVVIWGSLRERNIECLFYGVDQNKIFRGKQQEINKLIEEIKNYTTSIYLSQK